MPLKDWGKMLIHYINILRIRIQIKYQKNLMNIKSMISNASNEYMNTDGTIDFGSLNKNMNKDLNSDSEMNETMNNISIKLFDTKNNNFERNIERLENAEEVLADEEENFNETPDKISEKVASKNEKFNIKMNFNIQNNEQIKKFLFT